MHHGVVPFLNRSDAGRRLAAHLSGHAGRDDVLVLALPRGGVPVGFEIARALNAPLDVIIVRKLGVPGFEELAMGAIASGGIRVRNPDVLGPAEVDPAIFEAVCAREQREVERREHIYRDDRPAPAITGRTIILVDDGIATGSTMLAAARAVRARDPGRLIVAAPVAPAAARAQIEHEADEFVCLFEPDTLYAISMYYARFPQTTDGEVRDLLARAPIVTPMSRSRKSGSVQTGIVPSTVSVTNAVATNRRSATGSGTSPSRVVWPVRRARCPSSQSLSAATATIRSLADGLAATKIAARGSAGH